jgi:HK97 family phage major capsid protein
MSSGELFGGFKMEILAEEGTASKQTGKVRLIHLNAKKGAIFVDISSELEADGMGFEDQLTNALIKSIGYGIDKYCLTGTGAGQPQGVFNSACLISVAKETGQAADTICYANLTAMYARQLNKDKAVWLFNSDCVPSLMELTVAIGTAGSHVKVMNEKDGKFTIFGRPVYFTPHMKTIGDKGDSGFIDFGAYALGMRKEMSIDKSIAPGWTKDLVSYRIIIRFDGMGVLSEAVTPENGATLSPFVSLNERA